MVVSKRPSMPMEPKFRKDVVRALRAIFDYAADDPEAQPPAPSARDCKIALDWIIKDACLWGDAPFFPDDQSGRTDAAMLGRRYVAKQIFLALDIRPDALKD